GLLLTTVVVAALAFGRDAAFVGYPLQYTIFPLVIWAALRFGQRGTVTATAIISALAIWGTVRGTGAFATGTLAERLLFLQLYMAIVAVTGLLLGAAISVRNAAEGRARRELERLEESEERLRLALDAGRMGVWDWNMATGEVNWSDNLEAIHGLARGAFP